MSDPIVLSLVGILVIVIVAFGYPKARDLLESLAGLVRHLLGGHK